MNKYKIIVGNPEQSGFVREFKTAKALAQFKRRNPGIQSASYVFHDNEWQRYVIYGNQTIPESVLLSLLNSLNLSNSLIQPPMMPDPPQTPAVDEGARASSTITPSFDPFYFLDL